MQCDLSERVSSLFFIPVEVAGVRTVALLDSGARANVLSREFIREHAIPVRSPEGLQLVYANGEEETAGETNKCSVKLGTNCCKQRFVVGGIKYPAILGAPFLRRWRLQFDYPRHAVLLRHKRKKMTLKALRSVEEAKAICKLGVTEKPLPPQIDHLEQQRPSSVQEELPPECPTKATLSRIEVQPKPLREKEEKTPSKATEATLKQMKRAWRKSGTMLTLVNVRRVENPPEKAAELIAAASLVTEKRDCGLETDVEWAEKVKAKLPDWVLELIEENPELLRKDIPTGEAHRRTIKHNIRLTPGAQPVDRALYRQSPAERDEIATQVKHLLQVGKIRPSESPFGASVLLIKKKDGTWRFCIDYRGLNDITIKDRHPLPRIDDLRDRLGGAKVFTKIDLIKGYWNVEVAEEDRHKTAFKTAEGLYEWVIMPFGLCNAPATFQRLMNNVLHGLLGKNVVVYLDDILIFSRSLEEHKAQVREVLLRLQQHGLYPHVGKSYWGVSTVEYLGHIISYNCVEPDPKKVEAICKWPTTLTSLKEVRQFYGIASYYRMYIKDFARKAKGLTDIMKTSQPFAWTKEAEASMELLKLDLTKKPVLQLPDYNRSFILTTDASDDAVGGWLAQADAEGKEKPICFLSHKLSDTERRWHSNEKELYAVVYCLKQLRPYVYGQSLTLRTDNKAVTALKSKKPMVDQPRLCRWLEYLQQYDITLEHIAGTKNTVADALSRKPDIPSEEVECGALIGQQVNVQFQERIKRGYARDADLRTALTKIRRGEALPHVTLEDGFLVYHQGRKRRIIVPESVKEDLLRTFHDEAAAGHCGINKTYKKLAEHFWWYNMSVDVRDYVRSCRNCQENKGRTNRPPGHLQPLPIPQRRWQHLAMDFKTNLPKARGQNGGYDAIMIVIDRLSKQAHFVPVHMAMDAKKLAEVFIREVWRLHGTPETIVCDRDRRFLSAFWREFHRCLQTKITPSTTMRPQTDGQSERTIRRLNDYMRQYVRQVHTSWLKWLPVAEFAYNSAVQDSTGFTPFTVMYGENPISPSLVEALPAGQQGDPGARNRYLRIRSILAKCVENLRKAQQRQERAYNRHVIDEQFRVGQHVWLSTRIMPPSFFIGKVHKFVPRWLGPFRILQRLGPLTYRLELPANMRIHPVIHICYLKRHVTR